MPIVRMTTLILFGLLFVLFATQCFTGPSTPPPELCSDEDGGTDSDTDTASEEDTESDSNEIDTETDSDTDSDTDSETDTDLDGGAGFDAGS